MEDRGSMLQLASFAYDRGLAVALGLARRNPKRCDGTPPENVAQMLSDCHQGFEISDMAARARILDHRDCCYLARGRIDRMIHLAVRLFDDRKELSKFRLHADLLSLAGS